VDRPGVVDRDPDPRYEPRAAPEAPSFPVPDASVEGERGYEPIKPGSGLRDLLRKLAAPLVLIGGLLLKFGGSLKFLGIFVSVGGYALLWGWWFAVGIVGLILAHELGHYIEARRLGMNPALPVFIPFLGAYVALRERAFDPVRNARVTLAGPILGGVAAGVLLWAAYAMDSRFLFALAYTGFLLNLFNLLPVGILDGGQLLQAWRALRATEGSGAQRNVVSSSRTLAVAVIGTASALALGMYLAHVPQDRL
jgi:Zn-dependent protease